MNFRRIFYLLWFVVSTTFLLSAPCFGTVLSAPRTSRASSASLQYYSARWLGGARLSRKKLNPNPELQAQTSSVVTIPRRRVHRRLGVEMPSASIDPFFLQVAQLFDRNFQVRSFTRFQSNGRSPPNRSRLT
jgi:hypothetical protein